MSVTIDAFKEWYGLHKEEILNDYFTLLRFKSISADPAFNKETRSCAEWVSKYLESIGMDVSLWETSGQPVVFATHLKAGPSRPTVLIYHHYDVQPVDPLELWKSDPFEPVIREGHVYARGALDNKGQCAYSLSALKAFLKLATKININIKVFIEGEEESGGEGTFGILAGKKEELKADSLLIVDMDLPAANVPGITLGMRGILALEVECINAKTDLHSGTHGGIALNPNRALVTALSKLWDSSGKIAIPHFYEDLIPLAEEDAKKLDKTFDKKQYSEQFGVNIFSEEAGFSPLESNWLRPSLEINGISGGYAGAGFKTVIPARASAKLSCRLVPGQDPVKTLQKIKSFLKAQVPEGMLFNVKEHHGAQAFRSSFDSSLILLVAKAFEEVFNQKCKYLLCGASVPLVPSLAQASGAETALIGCGLAEDNIHAPNERFGLDRFEQGFLTIGRILAKMNEVESL